MRGVFLSMLLLSCSGLSRAYGGDPLFEDIGFELRAGERVGLVGPNGVGKSTLLKILAGEETPDTGSVRLHAGARTRLLRQHADFVSGRTLLEEAQTALAEFLALQEELVQAAEELAVCKDPKLHEILAARYDRLNELLRNQDAYSVDHKIEEVLTGLGFSQAQFQQKVESFSGGQSGRLMLAKLLLASPDIFLLDEPSNHLDAASVSWLERYLAEQPEGMLIVSHDRCFLDRVATHIFEMAGGIINAFTGNFHQYWRLREERFLADTRAFELQKERIEKEEEYIRRNQAGQLARQAQGRKKRLDRVERLKKPVLLQAPRMKFGEVKRAGDVIIEAQGIGKSFAKPLFKNLSFQLQRGKRLGICGPNGCGKSTLLRVFLGLELPDQGSVRLGQQVQVGYFDQQLAGLDVNLQAIRAAWPKDDPTVTEQQMRDLLGRFGIEGDVVYQRVASLSGGERSRICLAKLVMDGANVLVLDEPTNHLDLWACEALEEALLEFQGTLIVVTHDRFLLNRLADTLIVMEEEKVEVVAGNYEMYERLRQLREPKAGQESRPVVSTEKPTNEAKRRRKYPFRKVEELEEEIAVLERERETLESLLASPDLYRDGPKVKKTTQDLEAVKASLENLYHHWEEAVYFQEK